MIIILIGSVKLTGNESLTGNEHQDSKIEVEVEALPAADAVHGGRGRGN